MQDIVKGTKKVQGNTLKGFYQKLPAISDEKGYPTFQAVDQELRNKLLAMEPAYLQFLLAGLLSDKEIKAMQRRLTEIQIVLRTAKEVEAKGGRRTIMRSESDWKLYLKKYNQYGAGNYTYILDEVRMTNHIRKKKK